MKPAFTLLFIFFSLASFARQTDTATTNPFQAKEIVSFVTVVNAKYADKDGIYLNGYVVNLGYDQIKKLHRKKIRVTGEVILIKGIPEDRKEEVQGQYRDTRHIPSPKIEIVDRTTPAKAEIATLTTIVDAAHATKDGIYLNGYVVGLNYDQIQQLHGKKIKVTGEVTIAKGLKPSAIEMQGRARDTRHIEKPIVEVIETH